MDKKEALKKLATLEEETAKLRRIIESPDDYISLGVVTYEEVCKYLGEKQLTICDFNNLSEYQRTKNLVTSKLQQIAKLFNGEWKVNIKDKNQQKWYPYFEITADGGLVYYGSGYDSDYCSYGLVVYFKDKKTAEFVGRNFINLYKELHS